MVEGRIKVAGLHLYLYVLLGSSEWQCHQALLDMEQQLLCSATFCHVGVN